jgi:hypothetical protein
LLAAVVTLALVGANMSASADPEPSEFPYGVGASDVRPTSALLWTQTTASDVDLLVTTDPTFTSGVITKHVVVDPAHDGTVNVNRKNLVAGTRYYYMFRDPAVDQSSRVGTFQTAPDPGSSVDLTFGYSGDQDGTINPATNMPAFNSFETFARVLEENPDFYLNIGDTIYSDSDFLDHPAATLDEYRALYKQNLTYANLRNLRAETPFYTIWDDHEVRNDFDRSTIDPALFANGSQAFEEYNGMPAATLGTGYYGTSDGAPRPRSSSSTSGPSGAPRPTASTPTATTSRTARTRSPTDPTSHRASCRASATSSARSCRPPASARRVAAVPGRPQDEGPHDARHHPAQGVPQGPQGEHRDVSS